MRRSERRHRNGKIVAKRAKLRQRVYSWFSWSTKQDAEEPGKFRKRSALGCNCSDHSGMCHARKDGDTARVNRRTERRVIAEQMVNVD